MQSVAPHRLPAVAGRTQQALYSEIDLELSWSEDALPQVERTKHVHSLHPYLGKFIPQLVEVFLRRHFRPASASTTPSWARGRRSSKLTPSAPPLSAATSRPSTACS